MTSSEIKAVNALSLCRFIPGSWFKRFTRDLVIKAKHEPDSELTERQRWALLKTVKHFRRQLPREIVEWGEDQVDPELACMLENDSIGGC